MPVPVILIAVLKCLGHKQFFELIQKCVKWEKENFSVWSK